MIETPPGAAAHPIMFWVLTAMALAVFAPCVLVPIALETQEIRAYERAAAEQVAGLEYRIERNRSRIHALSSDPLVNERMVRRELNYRPETEQLIQITPEELQQLRLPAEIGGPELQVTLEPEPPWVTTLGRWLPAWPYRQMFGPGPNRTLLLGMAGGLLVAAFILYGRAPASPTIQQALA